MHAGAAAAAAPSAPPPRRAKSGVHSTTVSLVLRAHASTLGGCATSMLRSQTCAKLLRSAALTTRTAKRAPKALQPWRPRRCGPRCARRHCARWRRRRSWSPVEGAEGERGRPRAGGGVALDGERRAVVGHVERAVALRDVDVVHLAALHVVDGVGDELAREREDRRQTVSVRHATRPAARRGRAPARRSRPPPHPPAAQSGER